MELGESMRGTWPGLAAGCDALPVGGPLLLVLMGFTAGTEGGDGWMDRGGGAAGCASTVPSHNRSTQGERRRSASPRL